MTRDREEQIIKASQLYPKHQQKVFVDGVLWGDRNPQNLWHNAQDDNLPEIDREVIVLQENGRVCFGHRPNPDGYVVVNGERLYAQTYGKGGWNIPNVKWWLDVELPNMEEQQ